MPVWWYYRLFGEEFGPVSLEELQETVQRSMISADDQVRRADRSNWVTAASVPDLGLTGSFPQPVSRDESRPAGNEWFCRMPSFEVEFGPVPLQELVKFAEQGQLTAEDDVRHGASGTWWKAGMICRLAEAMTSQSNKQNTATASVVTKPAPETSRPPASPSIAPTSAPASKSPLPTAGSVTVDEQQETTTSSVSVAPHPSRANVIHQDKPFSTTIAAPDVASGQVPDQPVWNPSNIQRPLPSGHIDSRRSVDSGRQLNWISKSCVIAATVLLLCGVCWLASACFKFFRRGTVTREVFPVAGKVTHKDGRALSSGYVTFFELDDSDLPRSKDGVISKGTIEHDGTFRMGTYKHDDGVPLGKYNVVLTPARPPDPENPPPNWPPFNSRYARFNETPLRYTVNSGTNQFSIILEK